MTPPKLDSNGCTKEREPIVTDTDDELAVLTNTGGRSTYQNVGQTRRKGAELSLQWSLTDALIFHLATAYLDARYGNAFDTCVAAPCIAPTVFVPAGNHLPAVPASAMFAELSWNLATAWNAGIEVKREAKLCANDVNSDAADQYAIANARVNYEWQKGKLKVRAGLRVDDLFARRYIATVIVNEGNSRYFEPAPGRTWLATVNVQYQF